MIEIDCPECDNGNITKIACYNGEPTEIISDCHKCNGTGKITVYTEKELQEAIEDQKEKDALICEKLFNEARYEFSDPEYLAGIRKCYEEIRK